MIGSANTNEVVAITPKVRARAVSGRNGNPRPTHAQRGAPRAERVKKNRRF
jgi:hypothetical protein